jgi:hypothetical protein
MEKIQLDDEFDFIKIYDKKDLTNDESLKKIFESFTNILNSYQKAKDKDVSEELNIVSERLSSDFLSPLNNFAFILCSKKGCEGNNRKSISRIKR